MKAVQIQTNDKSERADRKPGRELRIGIVGAGKMAAHHAHAVTFSTTPARVVAIADPSAVALASMKDVVPEAEQFTSLTELLAASVVDVVHVCAPPTFHVPLAVEALEAGRHVYVEKPFAHTSAEAERILRIADQRGLKVAAGHQLLYESPTRIARELVPVLGRVAHIESYFSFRPVRRAPGGRVPLAADLQLLDILPHPVYLLLHFLSLTAKGAPDLLALDVDPRGTVHALVRQADVTASLVVTLHGRPVENYVRIVGSNGSLNADYVRGTVQRLIGPGTSGIDKVLAPYRTALQLAFGTSAALATRVLNRKRSYPGLAELFAAFYTAIQDDGNSPVTHSNIVETTRICERVAETLHSTRRQRSADTPGFRITSGILVTGGTGSLGSATVRELRAAGNQVRAVSRREPAAWERVPGVEYVVADLSRPVPPELFEGISAVIHTAAETAGSWEEHQRNSIDATAHVVRGASVAGVKRVVHVSSTAVLSRPAGRRKVTEETPLAAEPRTLGPYVWGKLESERLAIKLGQELGVCVKVVRPGPLVDSQNFEPPGRLGRRVGNFFVAVGTPRDQLATTDLRFAARVLTWILQQFESAPDLINLLDPEAPTKRMAIESLRRTNPDLSVVWLPMSVLAPISWAAIIAQKVAAPRKPAMNVARAFVSPKYETSRVTQLVSLMARAPAPSNATAAGLIS